MEAKIGKTVSAKSVLCFHDQSLDILAEDTKRKINMFPSRTVSLFCAVAFIYLQYDDREKVTEMEPIIVIKGNQSVALKSCARVYQCGRQMFYKRLGNLL